MNITDPRFRYNNAASHDAGSQAFRDRQRERMRRVQGVPSAGDAKIEELRKEAWKPHSRGPLYMMLGEQGDGK